MKSLVLAEKPSVGKELARVLDCRTASKGYCEGSRYVVTWALGHLVTLADPQVYDDKYKEWRLDHLPMLPKEMILRVIPKTSHQFRVVKHLMKRKDIGDLIIATDAGREGELVARWIMELVQWRNKPVRRLWISSQTDDAIRKGFNELRPGRAYENLFASAECRSHADWIIGLNVTRALTCKYDMSLNAGRVQTPTLAMIVDRETEIRKFKPVDFWTVTAQFGNYFGTWRNHAGNAAMFQYDDALKIRDRIQGKQGCITQLTTRNKSEPPPLAYDLTELQRDANNRFNFPAKKTLSLLQNLYERHKLVSYPRTDSRYITSDMIATLPRRLQSVATGSYLQWVEPLLKKPLNPGKRFVNDAKVTDHHAIIPTEQPPNLRALTHEERSIYDLIVRRFIAVFYPNYQYASTTLVTSVGQDEFHSKGKTEINRGWKVVTSLVKPDNDTDGNELPEQTFSDVNKGERRDVTGIRIPKSQTRPPGRYTEATLLTAMESPGKTIEDEELRESIKSGGLGTPATRAEIIEKLISNYYIMRNGKSLVPTEKAVQLIELAPPELRTAELTARWELRLSNIASGSENPNAFMKDIRSNAIQLINTIRSSTAEYKPADSGAPKCPMCGNPLMTIMKKKREIQVCSDRRCGYEVATNSGDGFGKRSKGEMRMNRKLINQYSDTSKAVTSLGDLLKKAMENQK